MACNSTSFEAEPVDGVCKCLHGVLTNGICNDIANCILPAMSSSGSIYCVYCNVSANLVGKPDANGQCICKDKYELINETCH